MFTAYGRAQAGAERKPDYEGATGVTAHLLARNHDTGKDIVLTGVDANGKKFRGTAKSVHGAIASFDAAWGLRRAWHIRGDGTRRLLFTR